MHYQCSNSAWNFIDVHSVFGYHFVIGTPHNQWMPTTQNSIMCSKHHDTPLLLKTLFNAAQRNTTHRIQRNKGGKVSVAVVTGCGFVAGCAELLGNDVHRANSIQAQTCCVNRYFQESGIVATQRRKTLLRGVYSVCEGNYRFNDYDYLFHSKDTTPLVSTA